MAEASTVPVHAQDANVVVQGFRGNAKMEIAPSVFIGVADSEGQWSKFEGELSTENAHILSEELRKHAEYASNTTTLEEK